MVTNDSIRVHGAMLQEGVEEELESSSGHTQSDVTEESAGDGPEDDDNSSFEEEERDPSGPSVNTEESTGTP